MSDMDRAHALYAPSASDRWIACPGSIQAAENVVDKSSSYALEGTSAHALLEACLRFDSEPDEFIGCTLQEGHYEITDDMATAVGHALDFLRSYLAYHGANNCEWFIEKSLQFGKTIGVPNQFGTVDILIINNAMNECVTVDYKHGMGVFVEAKENTQLLTYNVAARETLDRRFARHRIVIVQPRAAKSSKPVREWTLTGKELDRWVNTILVPAVKRTREPDAPRIAGAHCRWCRVAGTCKPYAERAHEVAGQLFAQFPIEDEDVPTKPRVIKIASADEVKPAKDMTPDELSVALDNSYILEAWVVALRAHCLGFVKDGGEIPGWTLGYGSRKRKWDEEKKPEDIVSHLVANGVPLDNAAPRKLVTPKGAEDALKAVGKWPKKPRGGERPKSPIDDLIDYTAPSARLVKEGGVDKFDVIPEEEK